MSLWKYCCLLRFSQTCELSSSKAAFTIAFFAAANHNYDHKQRTLKHRNTQNGSKSTNHQSQSMTFWTRLSKVLFPKRSAKMIDCSENANTNWLLNFRIRVFLKSAENTKEMHFLYEPGFTSFPTLKLKNSRDGRGLISRGHSIWHSIWHSFWQSSWHSMVVVEVRQGKLGVDGRGWGKSLIQGMHVIFPKEVIPTELEQLPLYCLL